MRAILLKLRLLNHINELSRRFKINYLANFNRNLYEIPQITNYKK